MLAIPIIIVLIIVIALYKKVDIFNEFIKGVKFGANTVFNIFPSLLGLIVAIDVFRISGAMDGIISFLKPISKIFNIPKEILPLVLLRPVSGSASLAMVSELMKEYGVDSFIGKVSSVLMGSTETILYTLSIYLGSIGIKKIKYTLLVAITVELISVLIAIRCCKIFFLK
ncbi:MAG: spore maturation protein [Clostridiales bacterium]|nr:spore maturation protein [Clostridiales bacterium]